MLFIYLRSFGVVKILVFLVSNEWFLQLGSFTFILSKLHQTLRSSTHTISPPVKVLSSLSIVLVQAQYWIGPPPFLCQCAAVLTAKFVLSVLLSM